MRARIQSISERVEAVDERVSVDAYTADTLHQSQISEINRKLAEVWTQRHASRCASQLFEQFQNALETGLERLSSSPLRTRAGAEGDMCMEVSHSAIRRTTPTCLTCDRPLDTHNSSTMHPPLPSTSAHTLHRASTQPPPSSTHYSKSSPTKALGFSSSSHDFHSSIPTGAKIQVLNDPRTVMGLMSLGRP